MAEFETVITPMLSVRDASGAIDWYKRALGAEEVFRLSEGARISHCELRVGQAPFMLADEFPEIGVLGPQSIGGTPVMILLEVEDVDAAFAKAIAEGATQIRAVDGDSLRNGKLIDPFGHHWMFMTRDPAGPELA